MKDISQVFLSGSLLRQPTLIKLENGTHLILFTIQSRETWVDASGLNKFHRNNVDCEIFGKPDAWMQKHLKTGKRYIVEGFIRVDNINGVTKTRVRVFNIQALESIQEK